MREILFRGKRKDNGLWVYGDLRQYSETHKGIYDYDLMKTVKGIIPETVGQYTGLTDNNGKKIFEGDIVEGADFTVEDGGFGVVSFDDGAYEVSGNNMVGTFHENYYGSEFEVIGNIHDNPELLN